MRFTFYNGAMLMKGEIIYNFSLCFFLFVFLFTFFSIVFLQNIKLAALIFSIILLSPIIIESCTVIASLKSILSYHRV